MLNFILFYFDLICFSFILLLLRFNVILVWFCFMSFFLYQFSFSKMAYESHNPQFHASILRRHLRNYPEPLGNKNLPLVQTCNKSNKHVYFFADFGLLSICNV